MRPNLFNYATSELSQDAFLAWLFKWAEKENEKEDKNLHDCAESLLHLFLGKIDPSEIKTIEISRQWENIDLWITINNEYHLIIEDKTGTSEHNNQLIRYKKIAKDWFDEQQCQDFDSTFSFVYFKTENITPYEEERVNKAGWKIFNRVDVLNVFGKYEIKNDIFLDYKNKIQKKQINQDSVFKLPFEKILKSKNKNEYIKGFYSTLVPELDCAYWKYVNNPSKSFYGMWWYWCEWDFGTLYFQFNEFDLGIRLNKIKGTKDKKLARNKAYKKIMDVVKESTYKGLIHKPEHFGTGNSMAIVKIDKSLWLSLDEEGCLDVNTILEKLHNLEDFLWEKVLGN